MRRFLTIIALLAAVLTTAGAQGTLKKVYDESIDPMAQIDGAVAKAAREGKFVVCQVGGNWCPWCLRFADFVEKDSAVNKVVNDNFVYIHVNYNPRKAAAAAPATASGGVAAAQGKATAAASGGSSSAATAAVKSSAAQLMERLGQPARFGFPVFVVLDADGRVLHTQDSSFLEEGNGYDEKKVLRFFRNWTPAAVGGVKK